MSVSFLGSMSVATNYGAGVLGAKLAIPSGAVAATPANLESLIIANAAGTDFALGDGTYVGTFTSKTGNGTYGDPNDHTKVVFDGEMTYASSPPAAGDIPDSGADIVFDAETDTIFANFTIKKYVSTDPANGGAILKMGGETGILIRNIESIDNVNGMHISGNQNEAKWCTSHLNGQYAFSGGGGSGARANDLVIENCLLEMCGDDNVTTRGVVAREDTSNRGGTKMVHCEDLIFRDCEVRFFDGFVPGIWIDGNCVGVVVEGCFFHDVARSGVMLELSHSATVRFNRFKDCHTNDLDTFKYNGGQIFSSNGGVNTFEGNLIEGDCANGIAIVQADRSAQNPAFHSPPCGSVVKDNVLDLATVQTAWVSQHGSWVKDGCDPTLPASYTITDNDEQGTGIAFAFDQPSGDTLTPAEWTALGFS